MSFWQSELGDITGSAEDAYAKPMNFTIIPDGTKALAKIDSFVSDEFNGMKSLNVTWELINGEFKGRKIIQKLKVFDYDLRDKDPKRTKHRALNMLKLIYQLFKVQPAHGNAPSDDELAVFVGKIAGLKIQETSADDAGKVRNYISEVHAPQGFKEETGIQRIVSAVVTHSNQRHSELDSALSRNAGYQTVPDDALPF